MLKIEKTRNTNDTASISSGIALNTTTSVKIVDANPNRIFFYASNDGATDAVWVKLQAQSVDNDAKGIYLNKKGTSPNVWEMPSDNIYTGEICAIADENNPNIYVTEY
ncbi:MAG: hypothetical protein V3S49_04855 [Thermodesulfobacteriota bacterium]